MLCGEEYQCVYWMVAEEGIKCLNTMRSGSFNNLKLFAECGPCTNAVQKSANSTVHTFHRCISICTNSISQRVVEECARE